MAVMINQILLNCPCTPLWFISHTSCVFLFCSNLRVFEYPVAIDARNNEVVKASLSHQVEHHMTSARHADSGSQMQVSKTAPLCDACRKMEYYHSIYERSRLTAFQNASDIQSLSNCSKIQTDIASHLGAMPCFCTMVRSPPPSPRAPMVFPASCHSSSDKQ